MLPDEDTMKNVKPNLTETIKKEAEHIRDWMIDIRRTIHQYPEPAFCEEKTSKFICSKLSEIGIQFKNQIGSTGVLAFMGTEQSAEVPSVALRADMDALPINEETGLAFSSRRPGFMHACGHDGHVAMLLGAAKILKQVDIPLPGQLRLLFQPAEEGQGGARAMIEGGCLRNVGLIFGGHIDCHFPVGNIAVQEGIICAYADGFRLEIKGQGGHAARPHEASDALVAASHFVVMVQSLVTRKINPQFPSIISIGKLSAGTTHNAIASEARIRGTIRTTHDEIRQRVFKELDRLVKGIEVSFGVSCTLKYSNAYPPVINSPEATTIAETAARKTVGRKNVIPYPIPSLGGEDFSFYLEHVPGCFVRFGAAKKDRENPPAHSPGFDFNEEVLVVGAAYFATCALQAMEYMKNR